MSEHVIAGVSSAVHREVVQCMESLRTRGMASMDGRGTVNFHCIGFGISGDGLDCSMHVCCLVSSFRCSVISQGVCSIIFLLALKSIGRWLLSGSQSSLGLGVPMRHVLWL